VTTSVVRRVSEDWEGGRGDGVRLKKKKKKKSKVMPGEMGGFGNKHLLEMERVVGVLILRMSGPFPTPRCYLMQNTNMISCNHMLLHLVFK
jgi:hypothetical protein